MLTAKYRPYILHFKTPGGTSRGVLHEKTSWFISVEDQNNPGVSGIGECGILKGLSPDDRPDFEKALKRACEGINLPLSELLIQFSEWPSIRFGLEMALADLRNKGKRLHFEGPFTSDQHRITINGLVWMGSPEYMALQIEEKINSGFRCIKMKIGAIDFEKEKALIKGIRERFSAAEIEIRVDANGAFSAEEAPEKLEQLAALELHSIEQPIAAGQWEAMARLCESTPLPIALDEELVGVFDHKMQESLIDFIKPQFLILKPGLLGGWEASENWIRLANKAGAGWWVTSALESNIGLNAIAQWVATLDNDMPQGLGTGQLFTNNFNGPLYISGGKLHHGKEQWQLDELLNGPWSESH